MLVEHLPGPNLQFSILSAGKPEPTGFFGIAEIRNYLRFFSSIAESISVDNALALICKIPF